MHFCENVIIYMWLKSGKFNKKGNLMLKQVKYSILSVKNGMSL